MDLAEFGGGGRPIGLTLIPSPMVTGLSFPSQSCDPGALPDVARGVFHSSLKQSFYQKSSAAYHLSILRLIVVLAVTGGVHWQVWHIKQAQLAFVAHFNTYHTRAPYT